MLEMQVFTNRAIFSAFKNGFIWCTRMYAHGERTRGGLRTTSYRLFLHSALFRESLPVFCLLRTPGQAALSLPLHPSALVGMAEISDRHALYVGSGDGAQTIGLM